MCGALLHVWALAGWLKLCFFGWPLALFGLMKIGWSFVLVLLWLGLLFASL
jgi:uncharacterized membrane-anchored protein YitT (DUF2179 family)